ncbi:hypothetical protein [Castellaniella sp.]|uniref:hypothetical protein n=1 Tax=Castellaniella sp. TaxID=1955812 RepID=UPI003A93CF78
MTEPTIIDAAVLAGYEAAHAWHVSLIDRLEALDKATGINGYSIASGLRDAFSALPADQQGAFLDAVGAYLMLCHSEGTPTREAGITPELLAVHASTPAEQDAWALMQQEKEQ